MIRKRTSSSPTLLLIVLSTFIPSVLSAEVDFSFYPTKAQPCLYNAAEASKCTGSTIPDLNKCLCSNGGGFVIKAAQCLGQKDADDVSKVYDTMSSACSTSNTPITISEKAFKNAAKSPPTTTTSSISSTATPSSTSTSSSSSSSTTASVTPTQSNPPSGNENNSSGLSKGAIVGIGVGAAAGGMLAMGALVLFLRRRQKKKAEDESRPMLVQNDYDKRNTATTFPPTEPSPTFGRFGSDVKASWGSSPSPGFPSPDFNADSSPGQYAGPFASPMPEGNPALHGSGGQAFEMDASTVSQHRPVGSAVEMEGSLPPTHQGRY